MECPFRFLTAFTGRTWHEQPSLNAPIPPTLSDEEHGTISHQTTTMKIVFVRTNCALFADSRVPGTNNMDPSMLQRS
eukprot:6012405-Amphidinium_carterae.1